jgi:hypothetical protein
VVQIPHRNTSIAAALTDAGWRTTRVSPDGDYPDVVRLAHDRFFPTDLLLSKTAYQREALAAPVPPASMRCGSAVEDHVQYRLVP